VEEQLKTQDTRDSIRLNLSKYLTEKYRQLPALNLTDKKGQSRFLFTKLRF
jgi:Ribosomal L27e protein family